MKASVWVITRKGAYLIFWKDMRQESRNLKSILSEVMQDALDEATDSWGVKVRQFSGAIFYSL